MAIRNTNAMMADTGGVRSTGGVVKPSGKTTTTNKPANAYTDTGTRYSGTGNKTTTTGTKTTTTTVPKTTTTTPKTTKPAGTQTTVTHADGTVSTAYLVNGRTVDANGNAYQFKNGDQVKTAGGTYTVNNGVGTKNETPKTNTSTTPKTSTVTKPGNTTNATTVNSYTDTGTRTTGTGNKTSTVGTKTTTTTVPKTTATTPKATATHTVETTPQKNTNPTAATPSTPSKPTIGPSLAGENIPLTDTATGRTYQELMDQYNALQAESDEITAARNALQAGNGNGTPATGTPQKATRAESADRADTKIPGWSDEAMRGAIYGTQPTNNNGAGSGADAGSGAGAGNGAGGGQTANGNARTGVSTDALQTGKGPAGSTPTTVIRNGQSIPAFLLNGRTVDASGNPFVFQNGDRVNTAGGQFEWNNGSAKLVDGTAPTGGNPAFPEVDPSNPPQTLPYLPDNARETPIYNADGSPYGSGYIINGVTYVLKDDGSLERLSTNGTPLIVQTQGGDYVMGTDNKGYTLDDYVSKYGEDSLPGLTHPGMASASGQGNASYVDPGTARPMIDYSNMSDGDLVNYNMNAIETGDDAALRDFMTWAEAESIARERMNPMYNQYVDQQMRDIDLKALQGGFYGQLPTEALRQQALAANEGNRTQAIIDYATQLLAADREGVLDEAKLNFDERQQRINTMMNLLESNRSMSEAEKDRELKKYIADLDSMNAQGKLANDMEQFNREMEYKYWIPQYQYNTANVNKK